MRQPRVLADLKASIAEQRPHGTALLVRIGVQEHLDRALPRGRAPAAPLA
jgi:hypothetical protein